MSVVKIMGFRNKQISRRIRNTILAEGLDAVTPHVLDKLDINAFDFRDGHQCIAKAMLHLFRNEVPDNIRFPTLELIGTLIFLDDLYTTFRSNELVVEHPKEMLSEIIDQNRHLIGSVNSIRLTEAARFESNVGPIDGLIIVPTYLEEVVSEATKAISEIAISVGCRETALALAPVILMGYACLFFMIPERLPMNVVNPLKISLRLEDPYKYKVFGGLFTEDNVTLPSKIRETILDEFINERCANRKLCYMEFSLKLLLNLPPTD